MMDEEQIDNESSQKFQAEETDGSDPSQSPLAPSETPELQTLNDIVLNAPQDIGNWCDLVDTTETLDINGDGKEINVVPRIDYKKDIRIIRASDIMVCQLLPDCPPYQILIYNISANAKESELYMLFGGHVTIAGHIYRSDLKEMVIRVRNIHSMIHILMKQSMVFKGSRLMLAVLYVDQQIYKLEEHNRLHTQPDGYMASFEDAHRKHFECGNPPPNYSPGDIFCTVKPKPISNDVRASMNYNYSNRPLQTVPEHQSQSRGDNHRRPFSRQHSIASNASGYSKTSLPNTTSNTVTSTVSKPKISPFGDAKPVDTSQKMIQLIKSKENQQQNKDNSVFTEFTQQSQNCPPQKMEIDPTQVKIQKRLENGYPNNTWVNTSQQYNVNYRHAYPAKHMNIMNETIDVSKPPPPLPQDFGQRHHVKEETVVSKSEAPKPQQTDNEDKIKTKPTQDIKGHMVHKNRNHNQERDGYKRDSHKYEKYNDRPRNDYRRQNSGKESRFDKYADKEQRNQKKNYHSNRQTNNQNLPPSGPVTRRKSSTEQPVQSVSSASVEKSQSAPLSQEGDSTHQSSRSSPSAHSLKRPNSANSSMSFVTALSGSEISTISTCIPGSSESVSKKPSDIEERRHSWEGEKSDKGKGNQRRKNYDKRNYRKFSRDQSRTSSASTPQYQSASSVFIDGSEDSETTLKSVPMIDENEKEYRTLDIKHITKTKNCHEKRAPSLPISRSLANGNDKDIDHSKDSKKKPDSLSAPPTPSALNKKRNNKKNKTNINLQNNKFHALADNDMNDQ